jgi:DNA-binding CsgD family transcriptional regulator
MDRELRWRGAEPNDGSLRVRDAPGYEISDSTRISDKKGVLGPKSCVQSLYCVRYRTHLAGLITKFGDKRELQIFCKLASGAGVSAIAEELGLSVKTVSTYRTRVFDKMGVTTIVDIVGYARE